MDHLKIAFNLLIFKFEQIIPVLEVPTIEDNEVTTAEYEVPTLDALK